jgi:ribulose-5-phosphate 4-epimerase/fuculose-1-phosphate aldolase
MPPADPAADVALVARVLSRLGLVHAFGHVSVRVAGDGPGWVPLTPTFPPLGEVGAADVLELDHGGRVLRAAAVLGTAPAMLLAGNGGLAVGADLDQALARAWCLEDRCRVALAAGDRGRPLAPEALARRRRWYEAETARLAR